MHPQVHPQLGVGVGDGVGVGVKVAVGVAVIVGGGVSVCGEKILKNSVKLHPPSTILNIDIKMITINKFLENLIQNLH